MSPSARDASGARSNVSLPQETRSQSRSRSRTTESFSSDSSGSSQLTALSASKTSHPYGARPTPNAIGSSSTLQNFSRPTAAQAPGDLHNMRRTAMAPSDLAGHRSRHHSQGFFEPSLPTTSANHPQMAPLTASQIAAQAAMQHQASSQHLRKSSQSSVRPQSPKESSVSRQKPPQSPPQVSPGHFNAAGVQGNSGQQYHNGLLGGHTSAATTAANAAFPRSPVPSPALPVADHYPPPVPEKEPKHKSEKPKMKLFSKPKSIGISKDKDLEKKDKALQSPSKLSVRGGSPLPRTANASTTSFSEPMSSASSSAYNSANTSTSTLTPLEKTTTSEREKEKYKHHFLSRQKLKLKEDHHNLPLSSASSNSQPLDPNAPQSLYSFTPSSPGPSATAFAKSMSGLDLRHGGRAFREKKKEEKASTGQPPASLLGLDTGYRERDASFTDRGEWPSSLFSGPSTAGSVVSLAGASAYGDVSQPNLQGFGLTGMTPDDAWPFLRAKLLNVFEGEDLRLPVEDLNRLVSAHIQRCVQKRTPTTVVEDFTDFLQTGFSSLNHTLYQVPDDRLVTHLVEMWLFVFCTILPYMQAVFLPLDLEFRGHGPIMSAREAHEIWGALSSSSEHPASDGSPESASTFASGAAGGEGSGGRGGEDHLDIRRIVLISYRDIAILPRYDSLKAIFSRLSLESIDALCMSTDPYSQQQSPITPSDGGGGPPRPGTAASLDPGFASFNSQTSTLLNDGSATGSLPGAGGDGGARSRATSNTSYNSAPSYHSTSSDPSNFAATARINLPLASSSSGGGGVALSSPASATRPSQLHLQPSSSSSQRQLQQQQQQQQRASHSRHSHQTALDKSSTRVTETVARMLQCVSLLSSVQTADEPQAKMEQLAKELKHNWLGRGRTGRNRRGFIGTKVARMASGTGGPGSGGARPVTAVLRGERGGYSDGEGDSDAKADGNADGDADGDRHPSASLRDQHRYRDRDRDAYSDGNSDGDGDGDGDGGSPTPTGSANFAGETRSML
ncbi:MAG: hypothetical protein M1819_002129 [Sarea resinae]|nr:MAG: hypothetical protein M1819_002129 [Sarea resinae]